MQTGAGLASKRWLPYGTAAYGCIVVRSEPGLVIMHLKLIVYDALLQDLAPVL